MSSFEASTNTSVQHLLDMLTSKRPAFSQTENAFVETYIRPLGAKADAYGNMIVDVGSSPSILWSSHTDTVHYNEGEQIVAVEGDVIKLAEPPQGLSRKERRRYKSNCLGADCTTGIWLMAEMIRAKVPGRYIFHASEENGGNGSSFISKSTPDLLKPMKAAIAFDRKGVQEVITHQFSSRCCSDDFAKSLALQMPGACKPSPDGTFTDTANYTDQIGECTNISVGYVGQHTSNEIQLIPYLLQLRDMMVKFDQSKLTFVRKPGEYDPEDDFFYRGGRNYYYGASAWSSGLDDDYYNKVGQRVTKLGPSTIPIRSGLDRFITKAVKRSNVTELRQFMLDHPSECADFMDQMGISIDDLRNYAPWVDDDATEGKYGGYQS